MLYWVINGKPILLLLDMIVSVYIFSSMHRHTGTHTQCLSQFSTAGNFQFTRNSE